jgi:hypothetical protein
LVSSLRSDDATCVGLTLNFLSVLLQSASTHPGYVSAILHLNALY